MQKKVVAMLVAGLVSGAACAQSSVTVYGRVNLAYVYSKSDYKKFQGVEQGVGLDGGASRLGFRGEEALGNGLKAIFQFEWGVDVDTGGGPVNARYTWAGLAGNFGSVTLGRIGTPSDHYMVPTTVQGFGTIEPVHRFRAMMGGSGNSARILDGARWNNSIAYSSPKFSGLDFMAIYSFGEKVNTGDNTNGNGYSCTAATANPPSTCYKGADTFDAGKLGLGVRYANGPLYLAAVYHAHADDDSVQPVWNANGRVDSNAGYGARGWGLGGTYDFKVVKLYANYFRAKANHGGAAIAANAGSDKETVWSLGIGIPVSSAGTIVAEYAEYKDYMNNRNRVALPAGRNPGHKAKGYEVGYKHALSRRTSLYTYVSVIDNARGIDAGWNGKTNVAGERQTNFIAGIAHSF